MKNPNYKGGATPKQLRDYALYRAREQKKTVKELLELEQAGEREQNEDCAIASKTVLVIELSGGGDADGYELIINKNGGIDSGFYYWADWGCYEEIKLTDEELENIERVYLHGDPSAFVEL